LHSCTASLAAALTVAVALLFAAPAGAVSDGGGYPWLGLADGQVGEFEWSVKVKHPDVPAATGVDGALRPCLLVGTKWQLSSYSFHRSRYRTCADARRGVRANGPPLIASGVQVGAGAARGMTAVGMLVAPVVRRIRVSLSNGRTATVHLRRLTREQARLAKLRRFRYAAFAVHGEWCAERVTTYNAAGATLWDSGGAEGVCALL
jgi:hypothetical protein